MDADDLKKMREIMEEMAQEGSRGQAIKNLMQKVVLEGEGRQMHACAIRWTLARVVPYVAQLVGTSPEKQAARDEIAQLIRRLGDVTIENMEIEDIDKLPGLGFFRILASVRNPDDIRES